MFIDCQICSFSEGTSSVHKINAIEAQRILSHRLLAVTRKKIALTNVELVINSVASISVAQHLANIHD